MKGSRRRKELLTIVRNAGGMTVNELSTRLDVSKMTVHRDLALLEQRGVLKRVFGGAVPTPTESGRVDAPLLVQRHTEDKNSCFICFRAAPQNLLYTLALKSGEQRVTCCPHCGLSAHLLLKDEVQIAMATDFLSAKLHPAQRSFFLMNSAASPCCQPSVLAFETEETARRFQTGFGGALGGLNDTLEMLRSEVTLTGEKSSCPHCRGPKT